MYFGLSVAGTKPHLRPVGNPAARGIAMMIRTEWLAARGDVRNAASATRRPRRWIRITSYNVCYTKLLRIRAAETEIARLDIDACTELVLRPSSDDVHESQRRVSTERSALGSAHDFYPLHIEDVADEHEVV